MKQQYTERLHPRQDSHRKPYWHRTRSNPKRRRKHPKDESDTEYINRGETPTNK